MKAEQKMELIENKNRQKAILKNLNEKLSNLNTVNTMEQLKAWHLALVGFTCSFLEKGSKQYEHILGNTIWDGGFAFSKSFQEEKNNAKIILQSFIESIEINGIPQSENNTGINVNTTVNQNTSIDISQTIREEIGNARMRELEELTQNIKGNESKFKVVANALKDFGIETLSSTLAKIILPYLGK